MRTPPRAFATLCAVAIVAALVAVVGGLQHRQIRIDAVEALRAQQDALVAAEAESLSEQLAQHLALLDQTARQFDATSLGIPAKRQRALRLATAAQALFDDLVLVAPSGALLESLPARAASKRSAVGEREGFRRVLKSGRATVASAAESAAAHDDAVAMAAPLRDADGRLVAVLVGHLQAHGSGVLGRLARTAVGRTGRFELVTRDAAPVFVVHPDRNRLGSTLTSIAATGDADFVATRPLAALDADLRAVLPAAEAYAGIGRAQARLWWQLVLAGTAASLLAAFGLDRLLRRAASAALDEVVVAEREGDATPAPSRPWDPERDRFPSTAWLTAHLDARQSLQRQAEVLRSVTEAIPAIVVVVGADGRFRFVNSAFERWYGAQRDRIIGRTMPEVLGPVEYARIQPWAERAIDGESVDFERRYHPGSGTQHLAFSYIPLRLEDGRVDGFVGVAQDITHHRQEQGRLLELAQRDPLTGLLNRAGFEEHLGYCVDGGEGEGLALLYVDLDHFKPVNDRYGHPVGDRVLQIFAARMQALIRPTDAAARLGGDEFAIVLTGVRDVSSAHRVADKIVQAAATPFDIDGERLTIGASVGVAFGIGPETGWREVVARADAMLYEAKKAGRGRHATALH